MTVSGQNNYILIFKEYLEIPPPRTEQVHKFVSPRLLGQSNGSSPTLAIQSAVPEEASQLIDLDVPSEVLGSMVGYI